MKEVFEGIKVADFSWVGVGPQIGRELAEHGATVVRIESHRYPDPLRTMYPFKDGKPGVNRSAFGAAYNTNKYGISLDLNLPKGQEVARRLIAWADIVAESMTPGTMAKWGLDYESCRRIKSDIIYFSTSQQGSYGPYANFSGYGMFGASMAGFSFITGWPDRPPCLLYNNYTDFIAPHFITVALVGALLHRHRTGKGVYLEQAQIEAGIYFLGPAVLDYFINNREMQRNGNRDPNMCPHGIFPCQGEDNWVAIAISTQEEWQSFCTAIEKPEWLEDARFSQFEARKQNEEELERLISQWTSKHTPDEIMKILQAAGVPAGTVQTSEGLFNDPQLRHRQHFRPLHHKVIGVHHYHAPAYRLSKTPCQLKKAGPTLGEDNEYVYKEILGLSDDEIAELVIEGVITTE